MNNIIGVNGWDDNEMNYFWIVNKRQLSRVAGIMIGRTVMQSACYLNDKIKYPTKLHFTRINRNQFVIKKISSRLAKQIKNWEAKHRKILGAEYLFPQHLKDKIIKSPDYFPFNRYFQMNVRRAAKEVMNLYKWRVKHKVFIESEKE